MLLQFAGPYTVSLTEEQLEKDLSDENRTLLKLQIRPEIQSACPDISKREDIPAGKNSDLG